MRRSTHVRKAKRSQGATRVSLFPFLAVLICTVGALVLLLVVVSRQARVKAAETASQQVTEEQAEGAKKLKEDREDVQWRIGHLRHSLTAAQQRLTEARLTLGHVEDHSRELREQLKQLEIAGNELERAGADGQKQAALNKQLDEVSARIDEMQSQVDQARREALGKNSRSHAIIPYRGPNGTRRRPIYLECRSDAVILHPEGIVFGPSDFKSSLGPRNPLAAALRATREYLLEAGRFDPSKSGEPYPLLLIRPSGVSSYEAAREAMSSWQSEFGYELIDEDWKLEFDPPDPRLARLLNREIARARMRTELLAKAAPQHYETAAGRPRGRGGRTEYTVSSSTGVVEPYGGEPVAEKPRRRWRGGGDRPSFSESRAGSGSGQATSGSEHAAAGGDSLASSGSGTGREPGSRYRGGSGSAGSSDGEPSQGGGGPSPYETGGSTKAATLPLLGNPSGNPYRGSAGGAAEGLYGNGTGSSLGPPSGNAYDGSSGGTGGGSSRNAFDRSPGNATGGPQESTAGGTAGPSSNTTNPSDSMSGDSSGGTSSCPAGAVGGSSGNPATAATSCPAGGAGGHSGLMPPAAGATPGSEGMTLPPLLGARVDPSRSTASGASGSPQRLGEWNPTSPAAAQGPSGSQAAAHRPPASIAAKRGRDWAVPETSPQSTPLRKPIRIECHGDRLVLVAERGLAGGRKIDLGPRTRDAMEDFTSAIWDYTESWGIAGKGMYWRPILHVYVTPGAETRYTDLEALLRDSGLLIKRRK